MTMSTSIRSLVAVCQSVEHWRVSYLGEMVNKMGCES